MKMKTSLHGYILSITISVCVNCEVIFLDRYGKNYDLKQKPEKIYLVINGYPENEMKKTLDHINSDLETDSDSKEVTFHPLRPDSYEDTNFREDLAFLANILGFRNDSHSNYDTTDDDERLSDIFDLISIPKQTKVFAELSSFSSDDSSSISASEDYFDSPEMMRSGLGCSKSASNACKKACKGVLKRGCDSFRCKSNLKSMFRRECAKNCKRRFDVGRERDPVETTQYPKPTYYTTGKPHLVINV